MAKSSLISSIKDQIKRSGANKGKFIYFKPGVKVRVRFLHDMDEGMKIPFHDSYQRGINVPCQELFGRDCDKCEDEELRHRDLYAWSVYDYDSKEVRILMGAVNNVSPVPALVGMYEAYETLTDRDYVITKSGTGTSATFQVVPMDKVKFKNDKAKPFSESKTLELLDKAFPNDTEDDDDDDKPAKGKGGNKKQKDEPEDYNEMTAKQLYKLCQERDIDCKAKKDEDYYIALLEEYDEENSEGLDYSEMSAKELYKLCQERDISCKPKKSEEYYIALLEEDDEAEKDEEDDW